MCQKSQRPFRIQFKSDPEVRREGRRGRWEESHIAVQFPGNLVRPMGSSQVKVTQQRSSTSPRKGTAFIALLCLIIGWEKPAGSMATGELRAQWLGHLSINHIIQSWRSERIISIIITTMDPCLKVDSGNKLETH